LEEKIEKKNSEKKEQHQKVAVGWGLVPPPQRKNENKI